LDTEDSNTPLPADIEEKCSEITGVGVIIASHPNQTARYTDPLSNANAHPRRLTADSKELRARRA